VVEAGGVVEQMPGEPLGLVAASAPALLDSLGERVST
jgi:hypothetical protein